MAMSAAERAETIRKAQLKQPIDKNASAEKKQLYYDHYAEPIGGVTPIVGGGGGSIYVPPVYVPPAYIPPPPPPVPLGEMIPPGSKTREQRAAEVAASTAWDNNPEVRLLQTKWSQIYIDTGLTNTPEQIELHKQSEYIRMRSNPAYGGSTTGPKNPSEADMTFPRSTTPNADGIEAGLDGTLADPANWGGYAKAGLGIFFIMMILSMFRR